MWVSGEGMAVAQVAIHRNFASSEPCFTISGPLESETFNYAPNTQELCTMADPMDAPEKVQMFAGLDPGRYVIQIASGVAGKITLANRCPDPEVC